MAYNGPVETSEKPNSGVDGWFLADPPPLRLYSYVWGGPTPGALWAEAHPYVIA